MLAECYIAPDLTSVDVPRGYDLQVLRPVAAKVPMREADLLAPPLE